MLLLLLLLLVLLRAFLVFLPSCTVFGDLGGLGCCFSLPLDFSLLLRCFALAALGCGCWRAWLAVVLAVVLALALVVLGRTGTTAVVVPDLCWAAGARITERRWSSCP